MSAENVPSEAERIQNANEARNLADEVQRLEGVTIDEEFKKLKMAQLFCLDDEAERARVAIMKAVENGIAGVEKRIESIRPVLKDIFKHLNYREALKGSEFVAEFDVGPADIENFLKPRFSSIKISHEEARRGRNIPVGTTYYDQENKIAFFFLGPRSVMVQQGSAMEWIDKVLGARKQEEVVKEQK